MQPEQLAVVSHRSLEMLFGHVLKTQPSETCPAQQQYAPVRTFVFSVTFGPETWPHVKPGTTSKLPFFLEELHSFLEADRILY